MKSRPFKVGVTIHPQQCTIQELRDAWRRADDLGVDSIWFWDHFFPLYGNPNGNHFECWSILAATVDQLSGGRLVLGLGAGWFARDYAEYGFDFGEARDRVRLLKEVLPRITSRIQKLKPGPAGPMPILIAGRGEKVMLRLVAEHAQMWNAIGSAEQYAHKSKVLDGWCERIGRDPREIERTANVPALTAKAVDEWLEAGLQHFVLRLAHPFDTKDLERVLKIRDS